MTTDGNGQYIEDDPDYFVDDYRCSACDQIGGHEDPNGMTVYDGCPKNGGGKHNTNGGKV